MSHTDDSQCFRFPVNLTHAHCVTDQIKINIADLATFSKVDEEFHPAKSGVHIIRIERLRDHFFKAGNYNLTQNKYSARGL